MNRVLWLQKRVFGRGARKFGTGKVHANHNLQDTASAKKVFISLPVKSRSRLKLQAPKAPASVYVHLPIPHKPRLKRGKQGSYSISPAWVSLFSVIATVFAAIGVLNIMINSLHLSAYSQGQWRAENAVHKPGSGPSAEDAVTNEYQHALTREMVPMGDTNIAREVHSEIIREKGMLDGIRVSTDKNTRKVKDGLGGRQVRIFNGTNNLLDKVIVQIDILSRSGHLLRTENVAADSLPPMGVKVIDVTNVLPDADLQCYIQEVRSKSLRTSLRAL